MYKIRRYFQGVWKQGKMVRWPKRKELATAVATVLCVVIFVAICLVVDDLIISKLLQDLDGAFPKGTSADSSSAAAAMRVINTWLMIK